MLPPWAVMLGSLYHRSGSELVFSKKCLSYCLMLTAAFKRIVFLFNRVLFVHCDYPSILAIGARLVGLLLARGMIRTPWPWHT